MRVEEIMSTAVRSVAPELAAEEAHALMRHHALHHLVVMDGDQVVGVISSEDLGGSRGLRTRRDRRVADLMSPKPVTAPPDMTVRRAANLMRGRTIGCLPVVEDDRLLGIVTTSDLIELIGRGIAGRPAGEKKRKSRNPGGRRLVGQESRRRRSAQGSGTPTRA